MKFKQFPTSAAQIFLPCVFISTLFAPSAFAQQRTFFNGGFEQNDPRGPGAPSFQILNANLVNEWNSTTNEIELWDDGFLNTPAYEGDVLAEMNANVAGTLFQEICLINGEEISWFFAHRARPGGPNINPQVAVLEIAALGDSTNIIQPIATQSTTIGSGWQTNSGTTNFTGTTGTYRIQFRSTNPGSFGNLIDALTLNISSFAVLSAAIGSSLEMSGTGIPALIVNGLVEVDTTIPITITGGTAVGGDDFTQTSPTLLIPAGLHFDVAFPLPITINDNTDVEPDETIEIALGAPSTQEVIFENTVCDGSAPQITATYTIVNDDTSVEASKTVTSFNDGVNGEYSIPGNDVIYTITATNTGPVDVDDGTIFLVDNLPPEISFYNGDIDNGGPETAPFIFTSSDPALTLDPVNDVRFSTDVAPPADVSECDDTPVAGYDSNIRHICFTPQGPLAAGETLSVSFRTRID